MGSKLNEEHREKNVAVALAELEWRSFDHLSCLHISPRVFQVWKIQVKLSEIQFCNIGLTIRKDVYDGISEYNSAIRFYSFFLYTTKNLCYTILKEMFPRFWRRTNSNLFNTKTVKFS